MLCILRGSVPYFSKCSFDPWREVGIMVTRFTQSANIHCNLYLAKASRLRGSNIKKQTRKTFEMKRLWCLADKVTEIKSSFVAKSSNTDLEVEGGMPQMESDC